MELIDTHVHINFDVYQGELEALSTRWREAKVVKLVHSCVHPKEFAKTQALANRFPELYLAVGLHPLEADKANAQTLQEIKKLAESDPRVVAIGEIGLDFYKAENHEQQKKVFIEQAAIARQLGLPVIIHCREASAALRDLLLTRDEKQQLRGVMHCWSGTVEETKWFLDLGFYISFSGIVTFKNATQVQESLKIVPSDRLLIETDCPFLAPVPKRGKRNEPSYVQYIAEQAAKLRGVSLEKLAAQTTKNARAIFGFSLTQSHDRHKHAD
ncbi:MAG: TatD family hydrolase [Oscillatoria sp. PMC 1051.18]|nr:TatD family hydrolase [Oscillatoria sp. PMC 1050.18]MEC5028472.1 TatD family hydrolase [Oscillatoria sp. PMC 1051.18]